MEVDADLIGMVKTNTRRFCKETIKNLTKDCPGGSYLLLMINPMVPGGRPIIAIGYKYNAWNVLYFITKDNTGSTHAGPTYLSKYPDQFYNVTILPVDFTLVMYNLFGYVNEV